MDNRTIVAPATAVGRAGISVIRISGCSAKKISESMCGPLNEVSRLKKCTIKSSAGSILDVGMVVFFQSPNSYTGEDLVEFHCHGNPAIVNLIIDETLKLGAVIAEPGEFTKTAFLNNKIDLAQAESVADLISAQSKSAIIAANSSLTGEFSKEINLLIDAILKSRIFIEANIDFPEDDLDKVSLDSVYLDLKECMQRIELILSRAESGVKLREGYTVAIVGPPNAGKSSLLNFLAQEDVAITSEIPGTTRDLVKTSINLDGLVVEFVDTAGIRKSPENKIEQEGIDRSKDIISKANLTLLVQDVTNEQEFDLSLNEHLTVLNKSDLLQDSRVMEKDKLYFSSVTGEGLEILLETIIKVLGVDEANETSYMSRQRHIINLKSALRLIEESVVSIKEGSSLELVAENLRSAHHALGEILRPMSADDLLGEIFSEFCIGK